MNYENYDLSFPDQPVVDLYLQVWANLPAFRFKPAFIWAEDDSNGITNKGSSTLTYGHLNESVQLISTQLLVQLQRGDTVVVLCSPGLELVEVIFACQRAGLLSVPIFPPEPSFTKEYYHHLLRVLSQTKPKAAIAHHDYIAAVKRYISSSNNNPRLAEMLGKVRWISTQEIKEKNVVGFNPLKYNGCRPEEVYLIQYTSGATGIPKPVLVTTGSATHNVRLARKAYDLHPNSVIASWLPQYHDCGLQFLLLTIVSGATCVLTSPVAFINRPRIWLEMISEFKATCTPVPSFTLPLVVKRGGIDKGTLPINLYSMRNLIIINEPIYKASVEEFIKVFEPFGLNPSSISPSYGLAENGTFVCTSWRSNTNFSALPSHNKLLPTARLASDQDEEAEEEDMEIVVVNEDTHEPVEDGIEGEIWISSPSNCAGYLGHPSLTREIFQGRLTNKLSKCFVRTGDRGIIKGEERFLYVIGRCSDVIKLKNNQEIHPHYLEAAAQNSSPRFVRAGCLAAVEISGEIVMVVELQTSVKDGRILRNICEEIKEGVFKEENVEIGLVLLVRSGSVPKTTSGKIQRWAAKNKLMGGKMSVTMEMRFDREDNSISSLSKILEEVNMGIGQEGRTGGLSDGREEIIYHSLSSNPSRPSLLSHL
ncbi:hypothetical protein Tsubulata_029786 [Turnera subulata]|uniref:AMP-dependent synthetase/ligase domain-containing protein n=1 Tax=Turnera subulata TaxID=218843 RepID=A0A9Q0F960_9ROSI|nr:hypothetical protein Tsubulata_029786 [Turnera subulata]